MTDLSKRAGTAGIRKALVALVLMICAVFGTIALKPNKRLADFATLINIDASVPRTFGDWRVDDRQIPVSPSATQEEALSAIYDQILGRTYVNSQGQRIMLSIAYGSAQTQQLRAHRQEVCYAAQGFQIRDLNRDPVLVLGALLPATRMVAVQGGRIEPVTYWFTMGDTVVLSYFDRQWHQLRYALSGYVPDGYLFRVSSISSDSQAAFASHIRFAEEALRAMDPRLSARLTGAR